VKKNLIKALTKENEKLREALINSLMPLHLMSQYYGRPSLKAEMISQAKDALKQAKTALNFDAEDMGIMTDTADEEWEGALFEIDAFLETKDDEDDD